MLRAIFTAYIIFLVSSAALAQTTGDAFPQSQTQPTPDSSLFPLLPGQNPGAQDPQSRSQGNNNGGNMNTLPLGGPRISNVSPEQEILDEEKSLQQQKDAAQRPLLGLPYEPDIEFQAFVYNALGMKLPIFGQTLFQNVPSTFAPVDRAPVPSGYIVGPGDELLIKIWGQIDGDYHAVVNRNGEVFLPQGVGALNVSGIKYDDLHDYLQSAIARVFKNFKLAVTMGRLRSIQVFVVGQVRRPGTYTISALSTLVDALFASGGPSKRGSMRHIQVKREGKVVTTFDLYDLMVNGDKSKDVPLLPGDVIYVPPAGRLVALAGSLSIPGIFELADRNTLGEVIGYGGGLTNTAAGARVIVERIDEHHIRQAEEIPLTQEGLAIELRDGDVVRFLHISSKFDNAITLRGNVALPGRYPWHPGMRVHDLIPDRGFLVTDDYWKRQNQLAVNAQAGDFRIDQTVLKNDVKRVSAEINWEYAVIQRLDPRDLTFHLLPFNLAKAIQGEEAQNLTLQPGDVMTIFSQADIQVPIAQQSKFMHLEGEVVKAGVYEVQPGETLRHLLSRVGGFTSQAYLYGSEFTRESTRVDQQMRLDQYINNLDQSIEHNTAGVASIGDPTETALAKAQADTQRSLVDKMRKVKATGRIVLELKPSASGSSALPDLVLEDGDRLLIPFRPAIVNVIGSVYNSSAFIFKPGETVADYIRLAGGVRRDGDKRREFVIRADGSTMSRQQHYALISNNFNALRLMPGDTIVVPEKLDQGALLRGLRDWTQILQNIGIGAAGVKVLFP